MHRAEPARQTGRPSRGWNNPFKVVSLSDYRIAGGEVPRSHWPGAPSSLTDEATIRHAHHGQLDIDQILTLFRVV